MADDPGLMADEIRLTDLPARRYLGIHRRVDRDDIGRACAEAFPRVSGWLNARGVAPDGPPALLLHSLDWEDGPVQITPAFFVPVTVEPAGDDPELVTGQTPGGQALVATHVGPYSRLRRAWETMLAQAELLNRPVNGTPWEVHPDDPTVVAPERLRTELVLPLD